MRRVLEVATLLVLIAMAVAMVRLSAALARLEQAAILWGQAPAAVTEVLNRRAGDAVGMADHRVAAMERTLDRRLGASVATLDKRLASVEETAQLEADAALAITDAHLHRANDSVAMVTQDLSTLAGSSTALVRRVDRAVADGTSYVGPWFNCGSAMGEGRQCFQDQAWWLTLKANTAMSSWTVTSQILGENIRLYAPTTAKSINGIAASVDTMGRWYTSRTRVALESGLMLGGALLRGGR